MQKNYNAVSRPLGIQVGGRAPGRGLPQSRRGTSGIAGAWNRDPQTSPREKQQVEKDTEKKRKKVRVAVVAQAAQLRASKCTRRDGKRGGPVRDGRVRRDSKQQGKLKSSALGNCAEKTPQSSNVLPRRLATPAGGARGPLRSALSPGLGRRDRDRELGSSKKATEIQGHSPQRYLKGITKDM